MIKDEFEIVESTASWEELHPPGWQKETIVSEKLAKLARQKGFNWFVNTLYIYGHLMECPDQFGTEPNKKNWNEDQDNNHFTSAPTQAFLQKWLRDEHNIHIHICYFEDTDKWNVDVYTLRQGDLLNQPMQFCSNKTYEDALEVGLFHALKNIQ